MQPISAVLSSDDLTAIADAMITIKKRLPFLVDLVAEERITMLKLSDKNRHFVATALKVADQNPDFLPRSFDVEEMRKDLELLEHLSGFLMDLTQLKNLVDDTCMVLGSEAYTAALTVYKYAKTNGKAANGLEPIVQEMGQYFRRSTKTPSQAPSA